MRVSLRLGAVLALLSLAERPAHAQISWPYLDTWPAVDLVNWGAPDNGSSVCYDEGPDSQITTTSLACVNFSHFGGTSSGLASKHGGNRQMEAHASVSQVSESNLIDVEAYSAVGMWNLLHFNVEAFAGDQLVFHFSTTEGSSLGGGVNPFTYTNYGLFLNGVEYVVSAPGNCDCPGDSFDGYAEAVTGGVDFYLPIGELESFQILSYFASVLANASSSLESGGPRTVYADISATLTGIDLLGDGDVWREAATFDQSGNAYFGEAATPEPASLVLLATGFAGFAIAARRRRKAH